MRAARRRLTLENPPPAYPPGSQPDTSSKVTCDLHFHGADSDFEVDPHPIFATPAAGRPVISVSPCRPRKHASPPAAGREDRHDRSGRVCHDCRVILLAGIRDVISRSAARHLWKASACCPFLNRISPPAGMIFKIAQHAFQLLFHFADLRCCSFLPLQPDAPSPLQFLFALVQT